MNEARELRNQLASLLTVRQAHVDFEDAVANFPEEHINTRAPNCPYTFWQLLEHMRLCQKDILDYIVGSDYHWPKFPDDYWPPATAISDLLGWNESVRQLVADRQRLLAIINDPNVDLFAPLPHSGEHRHNLLREINIIASHNAYHTGELVLLRRVMGLWP
jgi:hypothetical protein